MELLMVLNQSKLVLILIIFALPILLFAGCTASVNQETSNEPQETANYNILTQNTDVSSTLDNIAIDQWRRILPSDA